MAQRSWLFGWMIGLGAVFAAVDDASGGFMIVDLGVAGGPMPVGAAGSGYPNSGATGINATGGVSGYAQVGANSQNAVSSSGGGQFSTVTVPSYGSMGTAAGINAAGNLGGSFLDGIDGKTHVFAQVNGKVGDLGTLATGQGATASGINASNQIVGSGTLASGAGRAFRLDAGSGIYTTINPLAGGVSDSGAGINDKGWVVGTSGVGFGFVHAFAFDGTRTIDLATGLPSSFGANSQATAINNNDVVAGFGDVGSFEHAFVGLAGGPLQDIGVSGAYTSSYAHAINTLGQVVGQMDRGGSAGTAFAWSPTSGNAGPIDLNTLLGATDRANWHLVDATGINDSDQICGVGLLNGVLHGYELMPDAAGFGLAPSSTVPGPPAGLLAALGLGLAAALGRFKRGRTGAPAGA